MALISAKAINLTFSRATQNLRTSDYSWPPASEKWTSRSRFVALAVPVALLVAVQSLAQTWSVAWLPTLFGSNSLPADRPIWTMLVLIAGLWFGYLIAPVVASQVGGVGPGMDVDIKSNGSQSLLAIAVGVATQLGVLPVVYWIVGRFVTADPSEQAQSLVDRIGSTSDVILLGLVVVVIAPIVEEWFYRGFFLSVLAFPLGPLGAAVACSVVFALVHGSLVLVPGLMAFSLAVCALTMYTGRLGPAIIAHMAFNATTLILLLRNGW